MPPMTLEPTQEKARAAMVNSTVAPSAPNLARDADVVFHLAADSSARSAAGHATRVVRSNVLGTQELLNSCKEGARFVLASSASVYGEFSSDVSLPAREDEGTSPRSPYAASKLAAEAVVRAHTLAGRVAGVSLRLVACAGEGATHGLVRDLHRKLRGPSETLDLFGEAPGSVKPILYAPDAARALLHFGLDKAGLAGPVNVAPWDSVSVASAALAATEALGVRKPVRWLGRESLWAGDDPEVHVSNVLARRHGWSPLCRGSLAAVAAACADMDAEQAGKAVAA
jgi:UDP-glucose 4-epimerase